MRYSDYLLYDYMTKALLLSSGVTAGKPLPCMLYVFGPISLANLVPRLVTDDVFSRACLWLAVSRVYPAAA